MRTQSLFRAMMSVSSILCVPVGAKALNGSALTQTLSFPSLVHTNTSNTEPITLPVKSIPDLIVFLTVYWHPGSRLSPEAVELSLASAVSFAEHTGLARTVPETGYHNIVNSVLLDVQPYCQDYTWDALVKTLQTVHSYMSDVVKTIPRACEWEVMRKSDDLWISSGSWTKKLMVEKG